MDTYRQIYHSALGPIYIVASKQGIITLDFIKPVNFDISAENKWTVEVKNQLDAYFKGDLKTFNIPLVIQGTPFQEQVWHALQDIPYGETCTYKDIAQKINNPKACRAVGLANNKNSIAIIIPCHRVIGSNGSLVGYASGIYRKKALLELENTFM